uniref:Uncharacterized protein n=1 Tax=Mucochytrium quahogii TaxID=96639 RepID=A0A7S2RXV5_9STRA|mmetsp:Transcript_39574/g.64159  ORF Transcript_39574/g.64159 Transcript_39574/m.64159 type:complete len:486 (-) Transcript_39574:1912-3369(-)|eukprot:CAMPEP_0203746028 /NCGR_PEP_ID=MMETSP0098-20131031/1591_1 /ASSEMBLY_ACC=CAM_ASM_000208 /TAXON_ID=96639 /ORGANISM=" , Strain NY0313808BC1" /LENGTH=485 /DNA_ID=CAMNT_0050633983 /DNA_START=679 /DNA_END=2136 /DNA_ORIENTATION=+
MEFRKLKKEASCDGMGSQQLGNVVLELLHEDGLEASSDAKGSSHEDLTNMANFGDITPDPRLPRFESGDLFQKMFPGNGQTFSTPRATMPSDTTRLLNFLDNIPLQVSSTTKRFRDEDDNYTQSGSPHSTTTIDNQSNAVTPTKGITTTKGTLTLDWSIQILDFMEKRLILNARGERDWNRLLATLKEECKWADIAFPSKSKNVNTLFKQKAKLFLQERRLREPLEFWKKLRGMGDEGRIKKALRSMIGALPASVDVSDPIWNFDEVGKHLLSRALKGTNGPGSVIEWALPARNEILLQFQALHKEYGSAFHRIHRHYSALFALGEIELAITSTCPCNLCEPWGFSTLTEAQKQLTPKIRLQWTQQRAQLLKNVLIVHRDFGSGNEFFERFHKDVDPLVQKMWDWKQCDIEVVLASAHMKKSCSVCSNTKRFCRTRCESSENPDLASFRDLFWDNVETLEGDEEEEGEEEEEQKCAIEGIKSLSL